MEEESRNLRSQVDPTTAESNTRSIVHDGVATFTIDNVSTDVKVKAGQVGCFTGTDYTIETTGIIKDKSSRPGVPVWGCRIAGVDYTFDNDGHCTIDAVNDSHPENEPHHLWIVASSIDVAEGSTVTGTTRGGMVGTKIVKVDALTPRDTFAIAALEALIHRMDDPIECSTASVRFVTDKAYEFANSMMISSAYARVSAGEDEPSGDSPGTVEVDANTLSNNTEKLLNNIHKAIEASTSKLNEIKVQDAAKFTTGIKVDNPTNDEFDISGGGGGIDAAALKAACENNLNWQTLPNGDLVSIVGFEMKDGYRVPAENSISKLMKLLEAQEVITSNNSVWYWLRKAQGGTTITDITTFLTAYGQDIWSELQDSVDSRGNTNLASGGAWYDAVAAIADARITVKVKAESLNS